MTKDKYADNTQHIDRKFGPTYLAIKNKTAVYIFTVLLVFFGIFSYRMMPRELMPEIVVPYIFIQTVYPGNSPEDIENLITRPIEKELKGMQGVKKVSSASYQDMSSIVVEFNTDMAVKQALQDTKDRVDKAKSELPADLQEDPVVLDVDFSEFPIMNVNISGDFSMRDMKKYAELLQDEFESLKEVSEASIRGIDEREIQINVDPFRMEASGITFEDIALAVQAENITMGAGEFTADKTRRVIRTVADYTSTGQIANTIIKINNGKPVYIRDLATVEDSYKERSTIARLNDKPVVTLSVTKKSGENILAASDNVNRLVNEMKASGELPKNLEIVITDDNTHYIRNEIANLENSIIFGMILVILVLFLFLGFRNALFTGFSIPLSMFISFIVLQQTGTTLNNMVLYSLILALGMLVDNSIVAVENVYRLHSQGYTLLRATQKGISEIAYPIISSTLTTLAAFIPLLMWEGITGEFMKVLPQTLIIVLSSSLFVALVLTPPFVATFMKIEDVRKKVDRRRTIKTAGWLALAAIPFYILQVFWLANILVAAALIILSYYAFLHRIEVWFQTRFLVWLENFYSSQLRFALTGKKPFLFVGGTFLLLIFSLMFYFGSNPKVVFFPSGDPQTVFITMELPLGTSIDKTDQVSRQVESIIEKTVQPYKNIVKSVTTSVGNGKGEMFESDASPHKSLTTVSFVEFRLRDGVSTSKIMQELSENLAGFVGAKIFVEKEEDGPPVGAPVNIEVSGDEFDQLLRITDDFMKLIEKDKIPGVEELKLNINVNQPEMLVKIDRERARLYELSTRDIAMKLRNSLYGFDVGNFKDGEDEYDIFLRLKNEYRNDVSTLMNQRIAINDFDVPISAVADFEYSTTFDKISRIDHKRVISITSNVREGYNANQVNARVQQLLAEYTMPNGYKYQFGGEQQEQSESSEFLFFALLVAIALIMIIMVTQFNSLILPLIIMGTVMFSFIGVFLGLAIFQMEFVVIMTGIGIISLAGIVVNNGIVLIDYIDLLRARKKEELGYHPMSFLPGDVEIDMLVQAGRTRLRPVLLTAITTVLGLVPLAVGFNFDFFTLFTHFDPNLSFGGESVIFWAPMSWTVIFGLTFATFLTLIISPAMYMITLKVNYHIKKLTGTLVAPDHHDPDRPVAEKE